MKHNPAAFLFLLAVLLCFSAIHSAFGAAGDLDTAYNPNPGNYVFSAAVQPDGKLVIGGDFGNIGASARSHIARLDAAGAVDAGFNPGANGSVRSLVVQADGRIIVGGSFTTIAGTSRSWLARLNADGTLDTTFANTNVTGTGDISDGLIGIALQADGKILLCGQFTTVGGVARNNIARLNADGTLDTSFNPNANKMVTSMAVRSDGKIAIGGYFTQVAGASSGNIFGDGLAVLNASGTISQIYDVDGPVWSLAVQSDGKVLFGGWFTKVNSVARNRLGRLNADGSLDGAFVPAILLTPYYEGVDGIVVQANGQMIVCGSFTAVGGVTRNHIARLNADATLDAALNPNLTGSPAGGALQADGKFILVSSVGSVGGVARNWMARLLNDAPTESLAATSASRVQWLRGGAAPEAYARLVNHLVARDAYVAPLGELVAWRRLRRHVRATAFEPDGRVRLNEASSQVVLESAREADRGG